MCRYLSKTLVQQMRAQYKHVASSLAKVDARLMGYLRAYLAEFKEEYAHQGAPQLQLLSSQGFCFCVALLYLLFQCCKSSIKAREGTFKRHCFLEKSGGFSPSSHHKNARASNTPSPPFHTRAHIPFDCVTFACGVSCVWRRSTLHTSSEMLDASNW